MRTPAFDGQALVVELAILLPLDEASASEGVSDARDLVAAIERLASERQGTVSLREVRFS